MRKKTTTRILKCTCQILLDLDEAHGKTLTHQQCAKSIGVYIATAHNVIKDYIDGGVENVITVGRSVNSDNARRKINGSAEAKLIEMVCGPASVDHSRWTLRLLEEKANVELEIPVGKDVSGRTLKKRITTSQKKTILVHPVKRKCSIRSVHGRCP